ncbi:hypothetical protein [Gordonia iterans]
MSDDYTIGDVASAANEFRRYNAMIRVSKRRRDQIVADLYAAKTPQTMIAKHLNISQAQVSRILRDHSCVASPVDVIDERDVGEITDAQMLDRLIAFDYTYDRFDDHGDASVDAYTPGTWHELEKAFTSHRITHEQYRRVMAAHREELISAASEQSAAG